MGWVDAKWNGGGLIWASLSLALILSLPSSSLLPLMLCGSASHQMNGRSSLLPHSVSHGRHIATTIFRSYTNILSNCWWSAGYNPPASRPMVCLAASLFKFGQIRDRAYNSSWFWLWLSTRFHWTKACLKIIRIIKVLLQGKSETPRVHRTRHEENAPMRPSYRVPWLQNAPQVWSVSCHVFMDTFALNRSGRTAVFWWIFCLIHVFRIRRESASSNLSLPVVAKRCQRLWQTMSLLINTTNGNK